MRPRGGKPPERILSLPPASVPFWQAGRVWGCVHGVGGKRAKAHDRPAVPHHSLPGMHHDRGRFHGRVDGAVQRDTL